MTAFCIMSILDIVALVVVSNFKIFFQRRGVSTDTLEKIKIGLAVFTLVLLLFFVSIVEKCNGVLC